MKKGESTAFSKIVRQLLAGYNQGVNDLTLELWWHACKDYELQAVKAAIVDFSTNPETGKWCPKPADIAGLLQKQNCASQTQAPRLGGNEAWSIAVQAQDEAQSVVWTHEIADAFDCAQPIFQAGDKIGARMAFLDAYARIVAANKKAGIPPQVLVSWGWDDALKKSALDAPAARFLLAQDEKMCHWLQVRFCAPLPASDAAQIENAPESARGTNMPQWFADWLKKSKEKWARQDKEAQLRQRQEQQEQREDWSRRKLRARRMVQEAVRNDLERQGRMRQEQQQKRLREVPR